MPKTDVYKRQPHVDGSVALQGVERVFHQVLHDPFEQCGVDVGSQLAYKFYEKQGFTLNEIKRNYWADGFDMYSICLLYTSRCV